jgi:hypothetical protein
LPRLELRVERLQLNFRFTLAFQAREIRFEAAEDGGPFERIFPETFSFNAARHDPTELFLQLEDLLTKSAMLGPRARARDAKNLMIRILSSAPDYLNRLCLHMETSNRLGAEARLKFHQDVALLSQILIRFNETHDFGDRRQLRVSDSSLRRRMYESLRVLLSDRVESGYLEAYIAGRVQPIDPNDDPSESGFFQVLEAGESEAVNRMIVRMTERAFYLWLEGVCLDEENQVFEKEDSPFADRETEVLAAIVSDAADSMERGSDLMPFLRRSDRNCQRILGKLERWFLRSYDIQHSSAIIHHAAMLSSGRVKNDQVLTWHTPLVLSGLLALMVAPFFAAIFAYDRAPEFFNILCAAEVLLINFAALWFLVYRFCWKRELSFFHASVPRIGAGIVVGYLPVFLIDEVWDLASRPNAALDAVVLMLGLVTLLYIYVEVARRISDTSVAFFRARAIFLLGVVEAFGVGVVMTSLVGPFMVARNWSPVSGEVSIEVLRETMSPMIGQLPHVVGVGPIYAFPSALLLMTFLSFFIGVFLQLMWEELPITEPL